jgi:DNA polymerase III delta subunit
MSAKRPERPPLKPGYLILGDDGPKVERALQRLRQRIVEESGTELNIDEFRAGQHGAAQVVAAANTLAFLGGVRLVLVQGVEAWKKADKEAIGAYLRSPAPDACLALVGEKLPATDVLRKAVAAAGDILEYVAPKHWQLPEWASQQAASRSARIARSTGRNSSR